MGLSFRGLTQGLGVVINDRVHRHRLSQQLSSNNTNPYHAATNNTGTALASQSVNPPPRGFTTPKQN
jgi:hypothetical protein